MDYGNGYCLPIGYEIAASEAIEPKNDREASLARLNLGNARIFQRMICASTCWPGSR